MKYLVVLTKQFPFQWREQYVAHELQALANQFDKVYIYPHDHYTKGDTISFKLPKGVELIDLNQSFKPAPRSSVFVSFVKAFVAEWFASKRKWYQLKSWRRFYSIYATQFALGNMLKQWQSDQGISNGNVLYYSYWMSASALCLSILKQRSLIDGFITRAHSVDLYHEDWGLLRDAHSVPPFRALKEHQANVIFPISNHGYAHLSQRGVSFEKLQTAYLGVIDYGLGPSKPADVFTLVTCSGIDDNKRIHKLGEALSRLNREVRWVHFGDGPLRQIAADSVTSENVHFECRGQTSNDAIREFYRSESVHCFVNLSIVEGLPVSIMEAISHGIPVLATRVYGVPEVVAEGYNGRLIPVDFTDEQIDEALLFLMTHDTETSLMRINARKRFEELFDAEKNYKRFAEVLSSLRFDR